jgi:DNA repair exonuclease SbcCD ATPase subunit
MARPLPIPDAHRSATNGNHSARSATAGAFQLHSAAVDEAQESIDHLELLEEDGRAGLEHGSQRGGSSGLGRGRALSTAELSELEHVRVENDQLRALCKELEQALQEAAQQLQPDLEQQIREYDAVLEEKNEMIRQLHQQLQETQAALEEAEARSAPAAPPRPQVGHAPCEQELLALSEELERERRQLQEDEQTLMEQMREMEVSMARERAEMARQRNDLQRLQNEIRHELERLERDGGVQSKIESLRSKLQDVTARRGAAPMTVRSSDTPTQPTATPRKEGLMGRLFGRGSD